VTREIAGIRGIPVGEDSISPDRHHHPQSKVTERPGAQGESGACSQLRQKHGLRSWRYCPLLRSP
jgi:hypothetical protein